MFNKALEDVTLLFFSFFKWTLFSPSKFDDSKRLFWIIIFPLTSLLEFLGIITGESFLTLELFVTIWLDKFWFFWNKIFFLFFSSKLKEFWIISNFWIFNPIKWEIFEQKYLTKFNKEPTIATTFWTFI